MSEEIIKDLKQKLFEKAVRGLHSQGWLQCSNSGGWCVLNKGEPGFHCAIGWLIPWENQQAWGNVCRGTEVENLRLKFEEEVQTHWFEVMPFLCSMQVCHDGASPKPDDNKLDDMKQRFMAFGRRQDLIWPKLEESES